MADAELALLTEWHLSLLCYSVVCFVPHEVPRDSDLGG